jgi:cell division protein FtsA
LFTLIQSELRRSGFEDLIAAGIVLTGGTSKMEGVIELAEEIFHMPVRLGAPQNIRGLTDIVNNPIYSTGVGLLLYAMKQHQDGGRHTHHHKEQQGSWVARIKKIFQSSF